MYSHTKTRNGELFEKSPKCRLHAAYCTYIVPRSCNISKDDFYALRGSSIDFKENLIQLDNNNNLVIAIFVINHLRHLEDNTFIL